MAKLQLQKAVATPEGSMSSYDRWVESEGIPIIKALFVEDIRKVPIEPWERKGGNGAFLQLALRAFGSKKFIGAGSKCQPSVDRKKGGSQIEYADEDLLVQQWFRAAPAKRGVESQMAKH